MGFLATLREAAESAIGWKGLEDAWAEARESLAEGEVRTAMESLMEGLAPEEEAESRLEALRRLLDERASTVSQLSAGDDPRAAIGLLYPLVVFWRRGRLDPGALVGAVPVDGDDADAG